MLRELLASFDIDTGRAASALKNIDAGVEKAKSSLGGLAAAFVGSAMVKGLRDFVDGQIDAAKEVRLTAQKLGLSTDMLQEFSFAAGAAGVSSEGASHSLMHLNKAIGEALGGGKEQAETFKKLGISLKDGSGNVRELGDVLPEVADSFSKMNSQQERTAAAMKLFGRQGAELLPVLMGGSKGLNELRTRFHALGGGMSEDFIAKAKDAGRAMSGMKFGVAALKRAIAYELFPTVTAFGNHAQKWIAWLQNVAKETHLAKYAAIALGAGVAAGAIKGALGFARLIGVISKGAGLFESVLSLGYLGLIIAGVLALGLAFEDLFGFMNGEDSLIGDLMEKFFGAEQAAQFADQLRASWAEVQTTLEGLLPDVKAIGGDLLKLGVEALPYVVAAFVDIVRIATTGLSVTLSWVKAIEALVSAVASGDFKGLGAKITGAMADSGKQIGNIWSNGSAVVNRFQQPDRPTTVSDAYFGGRTGIGERSPAGPVTQTNNIDITVQGGSNPRETGQAVKQGATGALNDALGAVATGG